MQAVSEPEVACSVLMPVLNEERHIRASVEAMRRQRFEGKLEFIVVDGGSSDGTLSILRELAADDERIRVFENPRGITSSGLNVALAHARGRWVARMDAHTEYSDNYLALGVKRLGQGDTKWVSGPPIATGNGRVSRAVALALRSPLGRGASRKWASEVGSEDAEHELDAGVFGGVWERSTVLEYGGWAEDWVVNQDSEMAGRFLARGEKLVCLPAMAGYYAPRDSVRALWRQYLRYGEFRQKTAVRYPHTMRRSHLLAPGVVLAGVGAFAAPMRQVRRAARLGIAAYACALFWAGISARREAGDQQEATLVPLVLATMHLGHGAGFLRGTWRYGVPLAAVLQAIGLRGSTQAAEPGTLPVVAPSLEEERRARSWRED